MKRFRSVAFILAIVISIGLHSLLFVRLHDAEMEVSPPEPEKYQVTLRYFTRPAEVKDEQPKRRVKRKEEKQQPVEKPLEKEAEPVVQEEPPEKEGPLTGDVSEISLEEEAGAESEELDVSDEQTGGRDMGNDDTRYAEAIVGLRNRIMENKIYPQAARRRNIEGVVRVFLSLDAGGELVELRLMQSSGNKILDNAALSLVRKVIPYEHGLKQGFSVEIPIRYSLTD